MGAAPASRRRRREPTRVMLQIPPRRQERARTVRGLAGSGVGWSCWLLRRKSGPAAQARYAAWIGPRRPSLIPLSGVLGPSIARSAPGQAPLAEGLTLLRTALAARTSATKIGKSSLNES